MKVLGTDCTNCKRLDVRKVASEAGLQVEVEITKGTGAIVPNRIMATPRLVVDGR